MNDAPAFPAHWEAGDAVLLTETFSSRIWKVRLASGTPAIVKDLKAFDDVEDELRGAHYLAWRNGEGAVRLLGLEGQRMLLEYAGERHLVDDLNAHGDDAATEIAAEVLERLFSPSDTSFPPDLQSLRGRFASLFDKARADRNSRKSGFYIEAAEVAARLLDNPHDIRPLHGDLHHENIMHGKRGWLVIDPKGVLGDPAFDAANMFYNPLDRDDLCLDPQRIARMTEVFAKALRQSPANILDHAFAYGCLSAAWYAGDNDSTDEERTLTVAAAIRDARRQY